MTRSVWCPKHWWTRGRKVYALDINPVQTEGIEAYIPCDLTSEASIDEAFAKLPKKIDKFFGVAGLRGAAASWEAMEKTGMTRSNNGFAYIYAKLAMNALIAQLQSLYAGNHIRLNARMPGDTLTGFGSEDNRTVKEDVQSAFSGFARRAAKAEEMAWPLQFLNSDMASFVSGSYIFADYAASNQFMAGRKA